MKATDKAVLYYLDEDNLTIESACRLFGVTTGGFYGAAKRQGIKNIGEIKRNEKLKAAMKWLSENPTSTAEQAADKFFLPVSAIPTKIGALPQLKISRTKQAIEVLKADKNIPVIDVCRLFNLTPASLYNAARLEGLSLKRGKREASRTSLAADYATKHPDVRMSEIAALFGLSQVTIYDALKKRGIRRGKTEKEKSLDKAIKWLVSTQDADTEEAAAKFGFTVKEVEDWCIVNKVRHMLVRKWYKS